MAAASSCLGICPLPLSTVFRLLTMSCAAGMSLELDSCPKPRRHLPRPTTCRALRCHPSCGPPHRIMAASTPQHLPTMASLCRRLPTFRARRPPPPLPLLPNPLTPKISSSRASPFTPSARSGLIKSPKTSWPRPIPKPATLSSRWI